MSSLAERLHGGYAVTEAGCWEWKRSRNSRGYGLISERGVVMLTHRVSYELHVGPIPDGMQIDHLCRNKPCCNPGHLEAVTCAENASRRPDAYKTHCLRGHELTPENMIVKARPNGRTIRNCRTCQRERARVPDSQLKRARNRAVLAERAS